MCPTGHYCPPGSSYPTRAPKGTFAGGIASVAPTLCFPGTFAPLASYSACRACPAGFSCLGYGTSEPTICAQGTYRSLADAITCRLCPRGTYSPRPGARDISECLPCPAGRVCGIEEMFNLTASVPCPEGYTCGDATTKQRQNDHLCAAGVYCFESTQPNDQLANLCAAGSYCNRGTRGSLRDRSKCPVGSYCPAGTSDQLSQELLCPASTTSDTGAASLLDCRIKAVDVCDKEPLEHYYPSLRYTFRNAEEVVGNANLEVGVAATINPVNVSASSPYWVNDTLVLVRACPAYVAVDAPAQVSVLGYHFSLATRMYCRWHVNASVPAPDGTASRVYYAPFITEAVVESTNLLRCMSPRFAVARNLPEAHRFAATLDVTQLAGNYSYAPLAVEFVRRFGAAAALAFAQDVAACAAVVAAGVPPLREDSVPWFELRGMNVAKLSFSFAHVPPEVTYGEHFRIAVYVDPSICRDEMCDENNVRIEDAALLDRAPCVKPIDFSYWFDSELVDKHNVLNITLLALEDVRFHVELQILYGAYLSLAPTLINSTTV
ncbi:hypothetical protein EON62_03515, partial [archaeon]